MPLALSSFLFHLISLETMTMQPPLELV
uniref:Uncharacterized protein n=1 Tax=Arundo donax TaxID=35708 RepID=A0A0A9A6H7_ARUDO